MLTKITLENFKSFREKTEIDFNKTNYTFLPQNVADSGVLKGAVFVGANASGKSNVLEAIKLLLDLLFVESPVNLCKFVYHSSPAVCNHAWGFALEYEFKILETTILYSIDYFDTHEHLVERLSVDGQLIMERHEDKAKVYLRHGEPIEYGQDQVVKRGLFLRTLYFNTKFQGHKVLQEWMRFLSNSLYVHQADKKKQFYSIKEEKSIYSYLKENGVDDFNDFLANHHFPQTISYTPDASFGEGTIKFHRPLSDGNSIDVLEQNESTGNQALLRLLHLFFIALSRNCMLIVDEFSSCLHNDLEELLIKHFMEKSKQSQIFIVTHSTNLLSNAILRPDQEYAVQFDKTGSTVKRFSSEQPRLAQNVEKMYVSGVFGGLPHYHETES